MVLVSLELIILYLKLGRSSSLCITFACPKCNLPWLGTAVMLKVHLEGKMLAAEILIFPLQFDHKQFI